MRTYGRVKVDGQWCGACLLNTSNRMYVHPDNGDARRDATPEERATFQKMRYQGQRDLFRARSNRDALFTEVN